MTATRPNPASIGRSLFRGLRRAARGAWWHLSFHVRALWLGFEIRHHLPV